MRRSIMLVRGKAMKFTAVFFDRDGTIIYDRNYLHDPAGVQLIPGTGEALRALAEAGTDAFLVSNQSGIGRGYFTGDDLAACQARLGELLKEYGAGFKDARFCPHAPEQGCGCRKPGTGMWESLRDAYGLAADTCVMIGDKAEDLMFGRNAGMAAAILVLTGKGSRTAERMGLDPDSVGNGLCSLPRTGDPCPFYAAKDVARAVRALFSMRDTTDAAAACHRCEFDISLSDRKY